MREALKGSDLEAVKRSTTDLASVLQRVSTAAYQASASSADAGPSGDNGTGDGAGPSADGSGPSEGEEAVEGEFKEV